MNGFVKNVKYKPESVREIGPSFRFIKEFQHSINPQNLRTDQMKKIIKNLCYVLFVNFWLFR